MKTGIYKQVTFNHLHIKIACDYEHRGDSLILFIHGLGCSHAQYEKAFSGFFPPDISILVPDLAGHGDSDRPEKLTYTMQEHADILAELLNLFPEKKIHLACHSMGGAIGLLMCMNPGNRILSFINIEGNLIYSDSTTSRSISSVTEKLFLGTIFQGILARYKNSDEYAIREWSKSIRLAEPYAFYRSSKSLAEWTDSGKLLAMFLRLECPKCYIYGENNLNSMVLGRLGATSTFAIHGSGHFPMIDNPDELYDVIARFLRESL